jgi:heavy metal translocating P-type ATPase
MKATFNFLRAYKLFSISLAAIVVGLALELTGQPKAAHWLLGTVSIVAVMPLLWVMWQDVQSGKYGIDILATTAIVASVILGQYWAAIVVVLMLTGGEALEAYAERRARSELRSLLENAPTVAHVLRKGKPVDVSAGELHVGDKLLIKPGELVPSDAIIIEGSASFDESSLTGESLPQTKQAGDQLFSGSVNLDGAVTAKATATAANSQYQQIVRLVQGASSRQAPFVRLADRYSLPFTFAAYAIASAVWILSGEAIRFLEVILVATPCPLLLAPPIALMSGMARASRYGIIVKTGSTLERLAEAKTIAFDKTGTLTQGALAVETVKTFGDLDKATVLSLAASLEQNSNHVVAQAIVQAARAQHLKLSKVKQAQELPGRGLTANLRGEEILAGNLNFLLEKQVKIPRGLKVDNVTSTAVYIAADGKMIGLIIIKDELRPEAVGVLNRLRRLGIKKILMITGDNQATARAVGQELDIKDIYADMLPADKIHRIEQTQPRPLVFVGDGVNDAPALAAADVGIALGARGSTAASESADIVIMTDSLGQVSTALTLAKRTFGIARQSILAGIALSLALMAVFATGKFSPLSGAIIQELVDVAVIFNALRAHSITVND